MPNATLLKIVVPLLACGGIALALGAPLVLNGSPGGAPRGTADPSATTDPDEASSSEARTYSPQEIDNMPTATFAAGCFWGVEASFAQLEGVGATRVGYIGGTLDEPSYEAVCSGRTGHAEAVEVKYDPETISYGELLEVFWKIHDPTTLNRQGPDHGTQYRSAIFYYDSVQQAEAAASIEELNKSGRFSGPVVTQLAPAPTFWPAEEYHQRYFEKRGISGGCRTH